MKSISIISDQENAIEGWFSAIKLKQQFAQVGIEIYHLAQPHQPSKNKKTKVTALSGEAIELLMSFGLQQKHLFNGQVANLQLAQQFSNWQTPCSSFYTCDSDLGIEHEGLGFHHLLTRLNGVDGNKVNDIDLTDFTLATAAASRGKYVMPNRDPKSILSTLQVGLNVDQDYLANLLRQLAQHLGVVEVAKKVSGVKLVNAEIESLQLDDGELFSADFYLDLIHFNGEHLLPESVYENKSLLPDVKPITVAFDTKNTDETLAPINQFIREGTSWHRRCQINGQVYIETYTDVVEQEMLANNSQHITFHTLGNSWQANCLRIGSSANSRVDMFGLQLPMLAQDLERWFRHFPTGSSPDTLVNRYNQASLQAQLTHMALCRIPFLSSRDLGCFADKPVTDIDFQTVEDVESLQNYLVNLYVQTGHFPELENQIKKSKFWSNLLFTLGIRPNVYNAQIDKLSGDAVETLVNKVKTKVINTANSLP